MIRRMLAHPLAKKHDVDDPAAAASRREIISKKAFLREIYREWYDMIAEALPAGEEPVLEIGAGAGFLGEKIPNIISSEVFFCRGISLVMDATRMPFRNRSLRAVVMTDVLHHIPEATEFFRESIRVLRPGGRVIMIEPWVSAWSRFVYGKLHHEPFDPASADWSFPRSGPLSGANSALPWLIFERDRELFRKLFPELRVLKIELLMPFRYLLSGGLSMRSLTPSCTFAFWKKTEGMLVPFNQYLAMFAFIVAERR